jgi:deoxyribodipyrimidine photolyase-related protein
LTISHTFAHFFRQTNGLPQVAQTLLGKSCFRFVGPMRRSNTLPMRRLSRHDAGILVLKTLRVLLGDHLSRSISSLKDLDIEHDVVLLMEVAAETSYVHHHKQKIVLVLAAMRHFAAELRHDGVEVDYVGLEDPGNTGTFTGEVARAVRRHAPDRLVVAYPGEYRVLSMMEDWGTNLDVPVEIRDDNRFFCDPWRFAAWANGRRSLRMEFFYREMRRESGLLMDGETPVGRAWNYDPENRKPLHSRVRPPVRLRFDADEVTREVLDLVARRFPDNFGDLEPFGWAVTRADALRALAHFVADCLPLFGDYQDAMRSSDPFLFHATLSPYLNIGLLTAREVCDAAEVAWREGNAPLNAVEGFIRQILGWREYIRGVYWREMPGYAKTNALGATRELPWFYWSGETAMNCVARVVSDTRANAYAHHIQRLMITGNFALLAGIAPDQVETWYLAVYADAYDWVELPNTHGMVLFADNGLLGSKPYAASGAYINRMSDYCAGCGFDPKVKLGRNACPFNLLYWRFLIVNQQTLAANPRLAMPYRTLNAMSSERRDQIMKEANAFLDNPEAAPPDGLLI